MKKIKLLLLGIVSILGISLSYSFGGYLVQAGESYVSYSPGITNLTYLSDSSCEIINYSDSNFTLSSVLFNSVPIVKATILCGDVSLNNVASSSKYFGGYKNYSSFPYFQNGFIGYSDPDLSGTLSLSRGITGTFFMGENSCIFFTSTNADTVSSYGICSDSSESDCMAPINGVLYCGDSFYYYNKTSRYDRNYPYLIFKFPSSGSDTPQDFETPVQGGIRDYNTMLIEKAILCYMSDGAFGGEYGDCDGINYSGFINQYNPSYTTWSGSSIEDYYGQLLFTNAQPVLSNYCVNTDLIQYPFCSQLDLYSGAYLLYFFENGKLDYYVLGDGFGVDLGNLGSGQLGELTCQGAWCDNITQGLPEYIFPTNSGNNNDFGLSGDIISEDFYKDFIDKGFRFSCPYSYSGSYFVIGKDLINRLGGRDLMIPINCFISAFSMGSKMLLFGDPQYGTYWSGSLISGDTPGHQRLFLFFDLILSIGIVFVLFKLYNLFTSKK